MKSLACAVVVLVGAVSPFLGAAVATNAEPDPAITGVDIPDSITVGESFRVTVEGTNYGGRGGHYSTITLSSPDLDESDDGERIRVVDASDHAYGATRERGDAIYDDDGTQITADYALAEAGSDGNSYWAGGESRDVTVEFTPERTGTFVVYVRVTLPDDGDQSRKLNAPSSSPSRDQQGFYVRRYEVEVREEPVIDAEIVDFDQDRGTFRPGETVDASATVENTGNRERTFYVGYSVRGPDGDWRDNGGTTHEPVDLAPGERRTVPLAWEVGSDAPSGSYDVLSAVYADETPDGLTGRKDSLTRYDRFEVEEERTEATIADVSPASGTYAPGDVVRTDVTVENTGTTDHRFYVGYGARGPDGTDYDNGGTTHESVHLTEGERDTVRLDWTVPESAPEGAYDLGTAVYRDETSDGLVGRTDDRWYGDQISIDVPDTSARIDDVDPASGEYRSGESAETRVLVRNDGDTTHRFYVGYSVRGPNGDWWDNGGTTHETVELSPGEDRWVTVAWSVPEGAPTGGYDVRSAVYTDRSSDGLVGRTDSRFVDSSFGVVEPEVSASIRDADLPSGTYEPGDSVGTELLVRNTGDLEHTFFVGYSLRGPEGTPYDDGGRTGRAVEIAPGSERRISLSWDVPSDATTGAYDVVTKVYEESDRSNLETTLDSLVRRDVVAVQEPPPQVSIPAVEYPTGPYARGDVVPTTVTVENEGTEPQAVFVGYTVHGPGGDDYDDGGETGRQVRLDAGEERSVPLEWTAEPDAPEGRYGVTVAVWAETDRDRLETRLAERNRRDVFEVVAREETVDITSFGPNAERVDRGEPFGVDVTAELDRNTRQEVTARVELRTSAGEWIPISGASTPVTLSDGDTDRFTVESTIPEDVDSGPHDLGVVLLSAGSGEPVARATRERAIEVSERTGVVAVTVLGPEGRPVEDARSSIGSVSGRTGADGVVTFDSVPVGEHTLTVETARYPVSRRTVEVAEDDPSNVEVRLDEPSIEIVGVDGLPEHVTLNEWYTATISLRNVGDTSSTVVVRGSDRSGIEFEGSPRQRVELGAGTETSVAFRVRFYGTDASREFLASVETAEGNELDRHRLEVTPGGTALAVDVVDSFGEPVRGAEVRVVGRDLGARLTDSDGRVSFARLETGNVLVKTSLPDAVGVSIVREVELVEGERRTVEVEVPETGGVSGRIVTEGGTGVPGVTVEINGRRVETDDAGRFAFEEEFATGPYLLRVERDGNTVHRESIDVVGGGRSIRVEVDPSGDGDGSGDGGIVSNAQKGAIFGEVGVQSGMPAASTVEYLVGWLGGSVIPVVDAFADTRDCVLAPNAGLASNFIDCGGAVVSTAGSVGTVVGAITSPTGVGAAVGIGSFSLDTAEDVVTVSKHFITWTAKNPDKADEAAAALISMAAGFAAKAPGTGQEVISRLVGAVVDRGKRSLASKVRKARLVTHLGRPASKKLIRNGYRIPDEWYDVEKVGRWLGDVRSAEGYDELVGSLKTHVDNGDWKNVRGVVFESKVASDYKSVEGTRIEAIGRKVDGGELDVVTARGDLLEVKSSQEWRRIGSGHEDYQKLTEQLDRYKAYRSQEGLDGQVAVVFPVKPSNDVYDLLSEKGVDCLRNSIDGGVVPCYREPASISVDDRPASISVDDRPARGVGLAVRVAQPAPA